MKMLYASVLRLSRADCKALDVRDAYSIHRIVYSLFPKENEGKRDFLYVDRGGNHEMRQILVLSQRKPSTPTNGTLETKSLGEEFLAHNRYVFEVKLNPTKRCKQSGKNVAIRGEDGADSRSALIAWFVQKTPNLGFRVTAESLQVENIGVQTFMKDGRTVTHGMATFKGCLFVTDREKFIASFVEGIGRAKSFGFGFLQIIPAVER